MSHQTIDLLIKITNMYRNKNTILNKQKVTKSNNITNHSRVLSLSAENIS